MRQPSENRDCPLSPITPGNSADTCRAPEFAVSTMPVSNRDGRYHRFLDLDFLTDPRLGLTIAPCRSPRSGEPTPGVWAFVRRGSRPAIGRSSSRSAYSSATALPSLSQTAVPSRQFRRPWTARARTYTIYEVAGGRFVERCGHVCLATDACRLMWSLGRHSILDNQRSIDVGKAFTAVRTDYN